MLHILFALESVLDVFDNLDCFEDLLLDPLTRNNLSDEGYDHASANLWLNFFMEEGSSHITAISDACNVPFLECWVAEVQSQCSLNPENDLDCIPFQLSSFELDQSFRKKHLSKVIEHLADGNKHNHSFCLHIRFLDVHISFYDLITPGPEPLPFRLFRQVMVSLLIL